MAEQYVDFTGVETTFHDDEAVFTSVTVPFDSDMNAKLEAILRAAQAYSEGEPMRYTYWLTQGPQFETVAEVNAIERLGGDMVGMTMPREAKLAAELASPTLPFASLQTGRQGAIQQTTPKPLTTKPSLPRPTTVWTPFGHASLACLSDTNMIHGPLVFLFMNGRSVEQWMNHEPLNEWEEMMKKVAAFHAKHDFAGQNGHDMGYRLALTIEELGELAAAVTKGKPLEECAEEMADVLILLMGHSLAMELDLKAAFEKKYARIMKREALQGRLGVRVTEYRPE